MEVKIGIQSVARELVIETSISAQQLEQAVREAVADGSVLVLADQKGGQVLVPADKLAYIETSASGPRRVGFGAG